MNAITFPIHSFRSQLTAWQTQFIRIVGLNTLFESVEVSINSLQLRTILPKLDYYFTGVATFSILKARPPNLRLLQFFITCKRYLSSKTQQSHFLWTYLFATLANKLACQTKKMNGLKGEVSIFKWFPINIFSLYSCYNKVKQTAKSYFQIYCQCLQTFNAENWAPVI